MDNSNETNIGLKYNYNCFMCLICSSKLMMSPGALILNITDKAAGGLSLQSCLFSVIT